MASRGMRSAGIKITIDGEKELTAQIKRMQQEYKTLNKEIEVVQAQFAGQRNTLKALEAEYNATQAALKKLHDLQERLRVGAASTEDKIKKETDARDALEAELKKEKAALEELAKTVDKSTVEYQDQEEKVNKLTLEYTKQSATVEDYTRKQARIREALANTEIEEGQLNEQLIKTKDYLDDASRSADKTTNKIDKFGNEIDESVEGIRSINDAVSLLVGFEGWETALGFLQSMADKAMECVQAFADFEKGVVNVTKTVQGLSNAEVADFINELTETIPLTAEQLSNIAMQAGQYGISKDNLKAFTEVMSKLQTATNVGEDLSSVAQVASFLKLPTEDYERLASTVVELGNNTRTTEKDIFNMARMIAQQGKYIGLSNSEILGVADSLAALGGQAEGAGNAMNRFMEDLHKAVLEGGDELEAFAKTAGMSSAEFKQLFQTDAMSAITLVLKGIDQVADSGGNIYELFKQIGATNIRESNNLKNLSALWEEFAGTIGMANTAWEENIALEEEFAKYESTVDSQLKLIDNAKNRLKATLGESLAGTSNEEYAKKFIKLIDGITDHAKNKTQELATYSKEWRDSIVPRRRQNAETNAGSNDMLAINVPILFDYDPKGVTKDPKWTSGAEYLVGEFAYATKKAATGVEDPYIAIYNDWINSANKALMSSGSESPLSMLLDEWDNFIIENAAKVEEVAEQFEQAFDPLEEFSTKGQISLKEFNKNLETNRKAMEDYAHNMAIVMADENLSDAFKDYLKGLDVDEASRLLAELVGASDETKQDVSDNFDAMQQSIADSSSEFAVATGEVTSAIIDGMDSANLPGELAHDGYESVQGLIKSLSNKVLLDRLAAASRNLGKTVTTNYRAEQKIQSPSKVMEENAEYDVLGLIKGHKDREAELRESAIRMAQITRDAYLSSLLNMSGGISATINASTRDYTGVLNQISRNTGRNNTVVIEKPGRSSQSAVNDLERALVRGMLY